MLIRDALSPADQLTSEMVHAIVMSFTSWIGDKGYGPVEFMMSCRPVDQKMYISMYLPPSFKSAMIDLLQIIHKVFDTEATAYGKLPLIYLRQNIESDNQVAWAYLCQPDSSETSYPKLVKFSPLTQDQIKEWIKSNDLLLERTGLSL